MDYKLIANLPYYITGKFLRKFLTAEQKPTLAVLMLQKEVAERIVARDKKPLDSARGKESLLSISVKAYGEPKLVASVGKRYFRPQPKVDSAVLLIDQISNKIPEENEEIFFKLVKAGFASKRKKLFKNILPIVKDKQTLFEAFVYCQIGENERAENLNFDQWKRLVSFLKSRLLPLE
jgi:16S rRNA (adenine1518-N6/adenine1519-N6)-dimethyltransferase